MFGMQDGSSSLSSFSYRVRNHRFLTQWLDFSSVHANPSCSKDENRWEGMNSDVIAVGNGHGAQLAVNILKQAVGEKVGCINDIIYIDETGASIYSGIHITF